MASDTTDFSGSFVNIRFPSLRTDEMRISLSREDSAVLVSAENKSSKGHWKLVVNDIAKHGPNGFPIEVIFTLLKTALESLAQTTPTKNKGPEIKIKDSDPSVDGVMEAENFKLILTLNISGIWRPQFEFLLERMELDVVQVLQAQLRDALDEIQGIRGSRTPCSYLSLCSQSVAGSQQLVTWNGIDPCIVPESHFQRSEDQRTVTILSRGVYQVHCRLGHAAATDSSTNSALALLLDGREVAMCAQAPAWPGAAQVGTSQITEITELPAGATVAVRTGAHFGSLPDPRHNRLSILLLHQL